MPKEMNIVISGQKMKVTDSLKQYVKEKIGRLNRYYDRIRTAEVQLIYQANKSAEQSQRVEVTLMANGTIFRCEEASISMYASIDIAAEKLERQLKRFKEKLHSKGRAAKDTPKDIEKDMDDFLPMRDAAIVKVKRFAIKPMSPPEASMQMEMLNHTFYVFLNTDNEEISVIYKRGDGNYGLIEPELE